MKLIQLIPMIFVTIFCGNVLGQTYTAPNMIDTMQVQIEQDGNEYRVVNTIPNPDGNFIFYRVIGGDDSLAVANGIGEVVKAGGIANSEPSYTLNHLVPFPMYPGQTYWFAIKPYQAFDNIVAWSAYQASGSTDTSLLLYGSITGPVTPFSPDISTNVSGASVAEAFTVFPNPATDRLTFQLDQSAQGGEVYDAIGRVVQAFPLNARTLDVSHLAPGQYVVRVRSNKKIFTARFRKE